MILTNKTFDYDRRSFEYYIVDGECWARIFVRLYYGDTPESQLREWEYRFKALFKSIFLGHKSHFWGGPDAKWRLEHYNNAKLYYRRVIITTGPMYRGREMLWPLGVMCLSLLGEYRGHMIKQAEENNRISHLWIESLFDSKNPTGYPEYEINYSADCW